MRFVWLMLGTLATAGQILAQEIMDPPKTVVADKSTAMQWLITAVFLVGCLVVGFKPAKRSKLE